MIPIAAMKHQTCGDKLEQPRCGDKPEHTRCGEKLEHQRCEDKPAQANGLGFGINANSPERAAQRKDARFCPALSGLTALWKNIPKAMPWAGLFRAFGPAITTIERMKNRTTHAACQIGVVSHVLLLRPRSQAALGNARSGEAVLRMEEASAGRNHARPPTEHTLRAKQSFAPFGIPKRSLGTSGRASGVQAALPSLTNAARRIGVWIIAMLGIGLLCSNAPKASAAAIVFTFNNINRTIPDNSPLGLSDPRDVATPFTMILKVSISLTISGDFNGDLYVQVTHGSGFSVLLNRVGRTALNEFGYGDSGMDITLSDDAAAGEVHVYRTTLFGNENTPVAGMLTGVWAPDARITDPDAGLNTDSRSATLSSFNGLDPNGTWTLFVADASGGGQSTLKSWSVNAEVVPEPNAVGLLAVGLCLLKLAERKRRTGRAAAEV